MKALKRIAGPSLLIYGFAVFAWSAPILIPDNIRHASGIAPTAAAYVPFIETTARYQLESINHRLATAPDVVHSMAIGVAMDPTYPAERVKKLDPDLLLPAYLSDIDRALGGRNTATHTSILSLAVKANRMDIAKIILDRGGVDDAEAQRVAIEAALSLKGYDTTAARSYLTLYARAGGHADQARIDFNGPTLAEVLLANAPDVLLEFEDYGFNPWSLSDARRHGSEGKSLAETAASEGDWADLNGLYVLLDRTKRKPDPSVLMRLKTNLHSRSLKNPAITRLLDKVERHLSET